MASFIPKSWSSALGAEKAPEEKEDGDSLLTVLPTTHERSALTILIADCTEVMRQGILDTFDPAQSGAPKLPVEDELTEEVEEQLVLNPEADVIHANEAEATKEERAKKALEKRTQEIAAEDMIKLKTEALNHFGAWRQAVVSRVGEIVNSRKTAVEQTDAARPLTSRSATQSSMPIELKEPTQHNSDALAMSTLYPPIETELSRLSQENRLLVLHSVLLLLLSLESYSAYSRILLLRLTTSLHISSHFLSEDESKVAQGLLTAAKTMQAEEETKQAAEKNKDNRKWKVGLATVAGAALIGITGGLAAPLLAAGVGSVMGGLGLGATAAAGYLGTLAGSGVLVGGLFGAYGGRMTGKMMDQYAREVEDFAFVPVKRGKLEKESHRLRVAVGISGWLTNKEEVVAPWRVIGSDLETFALRFELESLMALGNALTTMITSAAWGYAKSEIIKRTVFAALAAGLWPLGLLSVSRIIDNPWSVANARAIKAGKVLADAIVNKAQGERPITLIGYSLGAKVITTCLQRLAEQNAFGMVENVVLIGVPAPSDSSYWRTIRAVVTGRVVNVFSTKDYILGFLYRSSSVRLGVAGLQPIENVAGVENVDVSEVVTGHTNYRFLTGSILSKIGFEDIDTEELEKERKALREEELKEERELAEHERRNKAQGDQGDGALSESAVKEMEDEIDRKNKQSYVDWVQEKMTTAGTTAYQQAKQQWPLKTKGSAKQPNADIPTVEPHTTTTLFDVDAPVPGQAINQKETIRVEEENAIL